MVVGYHHFRKPPYETTPGKGRPDSCIGALPGLPGAFPQALALVGEATNAVIELVWGTQRKCNEHVCPARWSKDHY